MLIRDLSSYFLLKKNKTNDFGDFAKKQPKKLINRLSKNFKHQKNQRPLVCLFLNLLKKTQNQIDIKIFFSF
jgi:hypothetical protein